MKSSWYFSRRKGKTKFLKIGQNELACMTLTAKNRETPPSREGVKNGCIQLASSPSSVAPSNLSILTMIDPILKCCQQQ